MGWAASNSFGRCGRRPATALKRQQYGEKGQVDDALAEALAFAVTFVDYIPPSVVSLRPVGARQLVVYSDAEYTPGSGQPPRLGWVVFPGGDDPVARTLLLEPQILGLWKPRVQQIYPAETFAPLAAIMDFPALFQGADVLWFVDNEAACSTLIRGASREEDVATIAELTQLSLLRLRTRVWFEWVDSKANPSDGLSREGLACPMFGHLAREATQPDWQVLRNQAASYRLAAGLPEPGPEVRPPE